MASYTSLDAFIPEIKQYANAAPDIMVRIHIRNAVIRFCERSMILRKDPSAFYLDEDTHTYTLKFSGDRYVTIGVSEMQLGEGKTGELLLETTEHKLDNSINKWRTREANKPTNYFLTNDVNTVRFYPMPDQDSDDEIFTSCIVKPKRNVTEIDTFLWEKWEEEIQAGALASLLAIPQASWYNLTLASAFGTAFRRGIRRARKTTISGTGEDAAAVVPQSYGGTVYNNNGGGTWTWA